jgi:hypothetical protein
LFFDQNRSEKAIRPLPPDPETGAADEATLSAPTMITNAQSFTPPW